MEEERDIETQIQLIKNTLNPVPINRSHNPNANRGPYQQKPSARAFMAYSEDQSNEKYSDNTMDGATHQPATLEFTDTEFDPLMEQVILMETCGKTLASTSCFPQPSGKRTTKRKRHRTTYRMLGMHRTYNAPRQQIPQLP
ncbi:hypothetical protein MHU86_11404 [Fragilaria crotonensis]|nr:hypothetical protein MHU86_11404 [Fragilaria crotonensis]